MKRALCKLPSLAKEGAKREPDRAKHKEMLRHQENGPLPLKARPGRFVQQPIIGGLNQPPRHPSLAKEGSFPYPIL